MIRIRRLSLLKLVILLGAGCAGHAFAQQPPLAFSTTQMIVVVRKNAVTQIFPRLEERRVPI